MVFFVTRRLSIDPDAHVPVGIDVHVFPRRSAAPSRGELVDLARGSTTLLTLVSDTVDGALLDALPTVKHIAQIAVGYDNIDVSACKERGVLVTHTPDVLTDATADLTWALILAVARRLGEGERLLRSGRFRGWSPTLLLGMELRGKTLGIYGLGRIGQAVARRAAGFGMKVIYASHSPADRSLERELHTKRVTFDALLHESDVLSIHAPLNDGTRRRFGAKALGRMKSGSILINTARGPIVDEGALAHALERGPLRGVGLDVYENEPKVHPSLVERDDVFILPHLGSATEEARARMAQTALADAVRVAHGKSPEHPIPEMRG